MVRNVLFFQIFLFLILSCGNKTDTIQPTVQPITESVYASGIIKSKNQYQVFSNVGGVIELIYVREGDTVKAGDPILKVYNKVQELNKENAALNAQYSDYNSNQGKLNDAYNAIDLARNKMQNDSLLYDRYTVLFNQGAGTAIEYEQITLNFHNSRNAYYSAIVRYEDLKRQVDFNSAQSKKNFQISSAQANDLTVFSKIDGIVYSINREEGEMVNTQTMLAVIGNPKEFELDMQVDEDDILKIKRGQQVFITMDSYPNQSFEGMIIKIDPMMNQSTKTFNVTALFLDQPETLYPNMNFEANIVIQTIDEALLIPRNYLLNDSLLIKSGGDTVVVKTGIRDFKMVQILSGISPEDQIQKPD